MTLRSLPLISFWIKLSFVALIFVNQSLEAKPLIVGTYNLHNLKDPQGLKSDFSQLPFVDIWGLQEVMFYGSELDPAFSHLLPASFPYIVAIPVAPVQAEISRWEGHVIVSRYPIETSGAIPLEGNTAKPRKAIYAVIIMNDQKLLFVNTDHDVDLWSIGYQERQKNVRSLIAGIEALQFEGPIVLAGDFNTADSYPNWYRNLSGTQEVQLTQKDFRNAGWLSIPSLETEPYTLRSFGITQQLDLLFVRGLSDFSPWRRYQNRQGSDHYPVFAELQLP